MFWNLLVVAHFAEKEKTKMTEEYLDSDEWASNERVLAFHIVEMYQSIIRTQFGAGGTVQMGLVYIAAGLDAGQFPVRFILHIPFYNPRRDLSFACPFTLARSFSFTVSSEYYSMLERSSCAASLNLCLPITIVQEVSDVSGFKYRQIRFNPSTNDTLVAKGVGFKCCVRGPCYQESHDDDFEACIRSYLCVNGSDERINAEMKDSLLWMMALFSVNYPTMEISITNPMHGNVPFAVNNLRLSIGNETIQGDKNANDISIVVSTPPPSVQRFVSFHAAWNRISTSLNLSETEMCQVRYEVEKIVTGQK
jgi:hypothetical protein